MASNGRRAVITGCGVVSPLGKDLPTFFDALLQQRSGVRPIPTFQNLGLPFSFGGDVPNFDAKEYIDKKERKRLAIMPRTLQFGVAAAHLALQDAQLDRSQRDPERFAVLFGSGAIPGEQSDLGPGAQMCVVPLPTGEKGHGRVHFDMKKWGAMGLPLVPPMWLLNFIPNMLACHVSILHDARGPVNTVTQSEAGGLLALGEAWRILRRGRADVALVGASDSRINSISGIRQTLFSELCQTCEVPEEACRPFDRQRSGAVLGEGGGAFVVEELEHASKRGARILAEVVGFGAALDRDRSGEGLARAIQTAMQAANIEGSELDHVNAHGLSTRTGDVWESRGLGLALNDAGRRVPVLAAKSCMGNLGSGSGLVELLASLMALEHGTVPATRNYREYDPECPVHVPTASWPVTKDCVLKISLTELGQCAAVVCRRWRS